MSNLDNVVDGIVFDIDNLILSYLASVKQELVESSKNRLKNDLYTLISGIKDEIKDEIKDAMDYRKELSEYQ